jgi:[acyl-carrier-protein] S-malonyltransferase
MSTHSNNTLSPFKFSDQTVPLAFLFPGQGSQHVGMAQELAARYPAARQALEIADELLGFKLSELCFAGPEEVLTDTINAQPALMAASIAALSALQSELGVLPRAQYMAGHSMGEYTALVAAGSIHYEDGLHLVRERGRLMKQAGEASPGLMAAVLGLDEETVAEICASCAQQTGGVAQVANDNCPGQIVISGDRQGMEAAMEALSQAGARRVIPLAVSIAAHSPLMAPAAAELRSAIEAVDIADPLVPIIGNTRAQPLTTAEAIRDELVNQLTGSVRWTSSMELMLADGVATFVEIGPGDVLTGLVKRIERKAKRLNVNSPAGVEAFVQMVRAG